MKVLDGSVGFLLARTARSMKRALEAHLSTHNITASQYIVLALLSEHDGISLSRLGERLYFDSPTITGIIDRMERGGLVQRKRTPHDRRVINIFLTPKGKDTFRHIQVIAEEVNARAMKSFTAKQEKEFLESLDRIWKKMNGHDGR